MDESLESCSPGVLGSRQDWDQIPKLAKQEVNLLPDSLLSRAFFQLSDQGAFSQIVSLLLIF